MAGSEWLRTFVAIYRAGSITEGASARAITQPAASQQLAQLERAVGAPLFFRSTAGIRPTPTGSDLYARIADPLDRLEGVLGDLDAGAAPQPRRRLRIGASAELFGAVLLPRLASLGLGIDAQFGDDRELIAALTRAEVEIAVTASPPPKRLATATVIGRREFVLVAGPAHQPARPIRSAARLAAWLTDRPWVAYSTELPITRRFWQAELGRPFAARLQLVAADLRVVAEAAAAGMGVSLLPEFVCRTALADGRLAEIYPVGRLVDPEPIFAAVRPNDATRAEVQQVLRAIGDSSRVPID